jgi:hypothetical protein
MWVQFLKPRSFERSGVKLRRYPGDWDEVGRQTALRWQAEGAVYIPPVEIKKTVALVPGSAGVLVAHGDTRTAKSQLGNQELAYEIGEPALPWARTAIWDGLVAVRPALIPIGLQLLDAWEAAIPLCDYEHLARDEGTEEEQQATAAVIRDLRVPVYDTRLMFLRDCENTRRLMAAWKREGTDGNERLAFLRALYRTPLLVLALPVTWLGA